MSPARKYQTTHPWITFRLDMKRAPPELWLKLGEARGLIDRMKGVPIRPGTADRLHQLYLAKGVFATTSIEGNSLTEEEVQAAIAGALKLPPSRDYLAKEVGNVASACDEVWGEMREGHADGSLSVELLKHFNGKTLEGLPVPSEVVPGQLRRHSVTVGSYRGAPAEDCEYLVARLCDWIQRELVTWPVHDATVELAIIKSIITHLYIAWIHPFGDGNGRTARLAEFMLLLAAGVPTPVAHLLSNHYNRTRQMYYVQLQRASETGGEVIPFMMYATEGLVDGLREAWAEIHVEQMDIAWRNYVYELFRDRYGDLKPSDQRRRQLVLDLSHAREPVPKFRLRTLSPELVEKYAGKTTKTLTRDINVLTQELGLIRQTPGGYEARTELILAFTPPRLEEGAPTPKGR